MVFNSLALTYLLLFDARWSPWLTLGGEAAVASSDIETDSGRSEASGWATDQRRDFASDLTRSRRK